MIVTTYDFTPEKGLYWSTVPDGTSEDGHKAVFTQAFLEKALFLDQKGKNHFMRSVGIVDLPEFVTEIGIKARIEADMVGIVKGEEHPIVDYLKSVIGFCKEYEAEKEEAEERDGNGHVAYEGFIEKIDEARGALKTNFEGIDSPLFIYDHDETIEGGFIKIGLPTHMMEFLKRFIVDFVDKDLWTEQNQPYEGNIGLSFGDQIRPLTVLVDAVFDRSLLTDEQKKLNTFDIGYFVSSTEWVHLLSAEELMQSKSIFREPFLHAVLAPGSQEDKIDPWSLIEMHQRDAFVSALSSQAVREGILQRSLGEETGMNLMYLDRVKNACHDYRIDRSFERLNTRVREYRRGLIRVEGLVGLRKEAMG